MAIGHVEQILQHANVSSAAGVLNQAAYSATTWGSDNSKTIEWDGSAFLLIVTLDAAATGTSPSFTVAVQVSDNGGAYAAATGGAISSGALSSAGTTVVVAPAGTGFMSNWVAPGTSGGGAHRYNMRVLVTAANSDNAVAGLSIHLAELI